MIDDEKVVGFAKPRHKKQSYARKTNEPGRKTMSAGKLSRGFLIRGVRLRVGGWTACVGDALPSNGHRPWTIHVHETKRTACSVPLTAVSVPSLLGGRSPLDCSAHPIARPRVGRAQNICKHWPTPVAMNERGQANVSTAVQDFTSEADSGLIRE